MRLPRCCRRLCCSSISHLHVILFSLRSDELNILHNSFSCFRFFFLFFVRSFPFEEIVCAFAFELNACLIREKKKIRTTFICATIFAPISCTHVRSTQPVMDSREYEEGRQGEGEREKKCSLCCVIHPLAAPPTERPHTYGMPLWRH